MHVNARRAGETSGEYPFNALVDSRGTFVIEEPADRRIRGYPQYSYSPPARRGRRFPQVKQKVSVISGSESTTTLKLDLSEKPTEGNEK